MLVLSAIMLMLAAASEVTTSGFLHHSATIESSYPQASYMGYAPPALAQHPPESTYSTYLSANQQYYANPSSSVEGEIKGGVKGGSVREIHAPLNKEQSLPLATYGSGGYFGQPTLAYVFIRPLQQQHQTGQFIEPPVASFSDLSQQREVYPMQQTPLAESDEQPQPSPVDEVVAVKTGKLLKLKKSLGKLASKFYIGSHEVAPPAGAIQQQKLVQHEDELHVKGPIEQQHQTDIKLAAPEISVAQQETKVLAKAEAPKETASSSSLAASGPSPSSSNPDDGFKRIGSN